MASAQSTSSTAPAVSHPDIDIAMATSRVRPLDANRGRDRERLPACGREPDKTLWGKGFGSLRDKPDGKCGDHRARHERRHQPAPPPREDASEQGPAAGEEGLPARRGGER